MSDLKQMQFVDTMSTRAIKIAEDTYSSARGYTPGMLEGTVTSLEGTLQPLCDKAKDVSSGLLKTVDAKVRHRLSSVDAHRALLCSSALFVPAMQDGSTRVSPVPARKSLPYGCVHTVLQVGRSVRLAHLPPVGLCVLVATV